MPKKKEDPARVAEDTLMQRASPATRALLAKSRTLKREAARKAWWKENER